MRYFWSRLSLCIFLSFSFFNSSFQHPWTTNVIQVQMVRNEKSSRFVRLTLWYTVTTILHYFTRVSYGQMTGKFFFFSFGKFSHTCWKTELIFLDSDTFAYEVHSVINQHNHSKEAEIKDVLVPQTFIAETSFPLGNDQHFGNYKLKKVGFLLSPATHLI